MKKILFLLFIAMYIIPANAGEYVFRYLDGRNGLANNTVNCIYRDIDGFMWFGTGRGLSRYDGYSFRSYSLNDKKQNRTSDNYITTIQGLPDGKLLVDDSNAYTILNARTGLLQSVDNLLKEYGLSGYAYRIFVDKNNDLWFFIMGKGVYYCNSKSKKKFLFTMEGNRPMLPMKQVSDMCNSKGGVIIACNDGYLAKLDGAHHKVVWKHDKLTQLGAQSKTLYYSFEDSFGNVWVHSAQQAFVYSKSTGQWYKSVTDFCSVNGIKLDKNLRSNVVCSVVQSKSGILWISSDHSDLLRIDVVHKTAQNVQLFKDQTKISANNPVSSLFCDDKSGFLWAGTYKNGLAYYGENIYRFGFADIEDVNTMVEDKQGNRWYGTNGNGIICSNKSTGSFVSYNKNNCKSILADVFVSSLVTSKGEIWFGSYWGGLYRYTSGGFVSYRNNPSDPYSLSNDNVWALAEDNQGNVWVGTLGGGVQMYDAKSNSFRTYDNANCGLGSDYISSITTDNVGNLVIGTSCGVSVLNVKNNQVTNYTGCIHRDDKFTSCNVNQVFVDDRGIYWIATREGLNIYNPMTDELRVLDESNGLASSVICGVIEDMQHNMWVTTSRGVSNVIPGKGNNFSVINYDEIDGLTGQEYNQRSIMLTASGEILMGCTSGINFFNPRDIKINKALPRVMFSDFELFNQSVIVGDEVDGRVILKDGLSNGGTVELNYNQNVFSILLGIDDYSHAEKIRYKYKLEGFSDNWLYCDADQHRISFTGLEPGTYVLHVKSVNGDVESKEESVLTIVVHPPFWRTPFAYFIYAVLLICIYLYHHRRTIRRQKEKSHIDQIRREAEKDHEVDEMKLRFFTSVSHELRTPLTLIITPVANMLNKETDPAKKKTLTMVHHNAQRLLSLVNQLLDFRKSDVSSFKLNRINGDIVSYIHNITNSFDELLDKKQNITFYSSVESLFMLFDEDKIGKVVMNLLSNACKFTPDGGRIDVSLQLLEYETTSPIFEIRVADSGVGISDVDKVHIFERFYQANQEGITDISGGSGIGLSLVKEFVTLHEGTVKVVDNVGGGSVFIVDLPVVRDNTVTEDVNARETIEHHSDVIVENDDLIITGQKNAPLVMIVDDSQDFLDFMEECFSAKYQIIVAHDGEEAWKFMHIRRPDIILSDVMMPVLNGNDFCKRVKSDDEFKSIPFVMLTARLAEEQKQEGLQNGADDYVTKPFNLDALMLKISKMLGLKAEEVGEPVNTQQFSSMDQKLVERAIQYINDNIARTDLSVEEVSESMGMSRVHFYKKVLCVTGLTPVELIRTLRLERAEHLLQDSHLNVSEVSYMVGFNGPRYFSKYFREKYGILPSEYQKTHCVK